MTDVSTREWLLPTSELGWVRFEIEILLSDGAARPPSVVEQARYDELCHRETELLGILV